MTPSSLPYDLAQLRHDFHEAGMGQGQCQACGYTGVFVEVHHVIERQVLRTRFPRGAVLVDGKWTPIVKGMPLDEDAETRSSEQIQWDPRNALLLCKEPAPNRCHQRHTLAVKRVPQSALWSQNWDFARELSLGWMLEANYPRAAAA